MLLAQVNGLLAYVACVRIGIEVGLVLAPGLGNGNLT